MNYILNEHNDVRIDGELIISNENLLRAINFCNDAIRTLDEQTKQFDINIFEVLGMRNMSGMVGEYFAKSVERFSCGNLHSNLHQDGYPDLLRTNTEQRLAYYQSLYTEESIFWDFIEEIPTVVACFYRNDLTVDDWGRIVQPKQGGGRTTSVSIMTSAGVKKMCQGWIAVIDSEPYISALSKKKWIGYCVK